LIASRGKIERIEVHDRDLGPSKKAPREAARGESAPEACGAVRPPVVGLVVRHRYANAMGSARESTACLETAEALGYLGPDDLPVAVDRLDHIVAILFKLCR